MSSVYTIGMRIALTNDVSGVLGTIAADMMGLSMLEGKITKGFQNMRLGVLGVGAAFASAGIVYGLTKLVDKGNEWVRVTRNMEMAGVSLKDNLEAQAKAMELTQKYRNMSSVDILKIINDARSTLGDQKTATEHIEPIVQAGAFLRAYQGNEKGGHNAESLEKELIAAMKSGEIAGKITSEDMAQHVRQLTAMKVAFGDQLKIGQYLTAQRAGGVALRNTSDEFRYGMFPALVQENGVNAGTMLMTLFNKVVAGTGNRTKSLEFMADHGLLDKKLIDYDRVGRAKGLKTPDAIIGNREIAMNFADGIMKYFKPAMDKYAKGDKIKEAQFVSQSFPDRNAAKAVMEIIQQFGKFSKDAKLVAEAYKASENIQHYLEGSWDYQVQAFTAQWDNLMTHLGAPIVGDAARMLGAINNVMAGMSAWAMANPEKARAIGAALAAIAAGLATLAVVLTGSAIIGAIGVGGWLIAGLAAFGTALGGLYWFFGNKDKDQPRQMGQPEPKTISDSVRELFESVRQAINNTTFEQAKSLAKTIAEAIVKAIPLIGEFIVTFNVELAKLIASTIMKVPSLLGGLLAGLGESIAAEIAKSIRGTIGGLRKLFHEAIPDGGMGPGPGPLYQRQRFDGGHDSHPIQKVQWQPPGNNIKTIQVHTAINVDGRVLARTTSDHLAQMYEHPTTGPFADGYRGYWPADMQTVTT
jgi:hypothetical protein